MTNDEYRSQCAAEERIAAAPWEVQVPVGQLTDAKARIASLETELSAKAARVAELESEMEKLVEEYDGSELYWLSRIQEVKVECARLAEAALLAAEQKAEARGELLAKADRRVAELEAEAEAVERAVKYFTGDHVEFLLEKMRAEDAPYAAGKR